ncbi:TPA: ATP-binding protein, partial [Bacillus cereus]|nr:ATP-binding protein [Bacillus cereus]HDT6579766.1 ATP-binding protein [Bacillus cereus]
MIQRNLQDACKSLHLSYIIDHYDEISFETKEQFLRDIFNIELESRQTKKVANLIKKAKFRELKWLKNYEWSEQIHLPSTTSQEHICELRFFEGKQNLLLLGSPGTGKTHLATALGLKACEQGYQVKFFRVADLVGLLEEALQQGNLTRIKKQIEACDLLILDELG